MGNAAPADDEEILELTLRAYREFESIMAPAAWQGLEAAIRRTLRAATEPEKIVARQEERLVGSVLLYPEGADAYGGALPPLPYPEVRLLAVDPRTRGAGVGRALMDECIRRARAQGAQRLGIHTSRSMRTAREMYRSMGFERLTDHDFQPPGTELVEAYVLDLER